MTARVHSCLPDPHRQVLARALGELEHHAAPPDDPVAAAEAAAADPDTIAFVGPFRSQEVGWTAAILNRAGIAQVAPAATYAALTRREPGAEDGMPDSLFPTGERTLFRVAARDTAIARAIAARAGGRARLLGGLGAYALQITAQLRLAGLGDDPSAPIAVYAGLADEAPLETIRALAPVPVLCFDGAAQGDFPAAAGEHVRFVFHGRGGEGWSNLDTLAFLPHAAEAGLLVYGSAMTGGRSREGVLAGLRACGRFDEHGDTRERVFGLWRWGGDGFLYLGTIEDPGE